MDIISIASFDIGCKNFAFYIEEMDRHELENIENIDKKDRYNQNGTLTNDFSILINKIYHNGKKILIKKKQS